MAFKRHSKTSGSLVVAIVTVLTMTVACSPTSNAPVTPEKPQATLAPSDTWSGLIQRTPYPYTTPLPPTDASSVDGTYVKFDPRPGERAPCRRCPPYPPEGGIWRLSLDRGVFRVYHDGTGWGTLGSFAVSEDRIEFFNDPHCLQDVGIYTWELRDGKLMLSVVEDNCGVDLRLRNLVAYPWESCQPPSTEAAITDHWPTPVGCGTIKTEP
jgi:hypothetical protein